MITYSIAIDYEADGNFTELNDSITDAIQSVRWRLGLERALDNISDVAQAEIIVRNKLKNFSPTISHALIGLWVRIQSDDGTTVRTHFIGRIARLEPHAGNQGERLAVIYAVGRESDLLRQQVNMPFLTNVRADEAIDEIVSQIAWHYDVLAGRCIIGVSSIGSSDIFPTEIITTQFESGKSVFAFFGDDWSEDISGYDAIRRLAAGENGRFFFNRTGEAIFHNRHHQLYDAAVAATFNDDMTALSYDYGDVFNQIDVTFRPRTVGVPNQILWGLSNAMRLERLSTIRLIVPYTLDDEPVGASTLAPLVSGVDYVANQFSTGSGDDLSNLVSVVIEDAGLTAATLVIQNDYKQTAYLTALNIRGTPIFSDDDITFTLKDTLNQVYYGQQIWSIEAPTITDIDEAIGLARWELQRRVTPRGRVRMLATDTRHHPTQALALTLFDKIRVVESQTEHDAHYTIVSETHEIDQGGARHRVQWLLEPDESDLFFVIGTHSIGDDVILVPR